MSGTKLQHEAQRKAQRLLQAVEHFPFAAELDRSAWLAALLTVVARFSCLPAPLFVVTASARATPKTLLVDALAIIATGLLAPRMRHSPGEADQRRQVINVAQAKLPLVVLDDVVLPLGSPPLDRALTSDHWLVPLSRKPGLSELPLDTVWFATGIDVRFRKGAETQRRSITIELDDTSPAGDDQPPDKMRSRLLGQAAELRSLAESIIQLHQSAQAAADSSLAQVEHYLNCTTPSASFENWSASVRATVIWLGLPDPWLACASIRAESKNAAPGATPAPPRPSRWKPYTDSWPADKHAFSLRLRSALDQSGLSLAALASSAELTARTVHELLQGRRWASQDTRSRLIRVLEPTNAGSGEVLSGEQGELPAPGQTDAR